MALYVEHMNYEVKIAAKIDSFVDPAKQK